MKQDNLMFGLFIIALVFVGVSLLINTSKSCDVKIDYNVKVNPINNVTASLPEIKLACYKLCAEQLRYDDSLMRNCFEKCEELK